MDVYVCGEVVVGRGKARLALVVLRTKASLTCSLDHFLTPGFCGEKEETTLLASFATTCTSAERLTLCELV